MFPETLQKLLIRLNKIFKAVCSSGWGLQNVYNRGGGDTVDSTVHSGLNYYIEALGNIKTIIIQNRYYEPKYIPSN